MEGAKDTTYFLLSTGYNISYTDHLCGSFGMGSHSFGHPTLGPGDTDSVIVFGFQAVPGTQQSVYLPVYLQKSCKTKPLDYLHCY